MEENLLSVVLGANWRTWSISAAIWSAVWCAMLGGAVMIASIYSAFTGAAVFRLIMGAIGSKAAKSE